MKIFFRFDKKAKKKGPNEKKLQLETKSFNHNDENFSFKTTILRKLDK